jgi:hypothetical protein
MPDQFIYREAVPGYIWTITRPFLRFKAKVGGRASLIRLANGDVLVLSPVPLEEGTRNWVDTIGRVKYLVAPDLEVPSVIGLSDNKALHVSQRVEDSVSRCRGHRTQGSRYSAPRNQIRLPLFGRLVGPHIRG